METPRDPIAFTDAMADILRLPDEALAMSYIYLNRYKRFLNSSDVSDLLDPYVRDPPESQLTLSLACLSLASKALESPRRLREFLLPAYRLLHLRNNLRGNSLMVSSTQYDALRSTLVQAELLLLRVLGFELRISSPLTYLSRYLQRALGDSIEVSEDYDKWGKEEREEYGVTDFMETGIGKACKAKAVQSCKNFQLANMFPVRAVALGCLHVVMKERGLQGDDGLAIWTDLVSGGKVDIEDITEVIETLQKD